MSSSSRHDAHTPIAIVGAGMGGLVLARVLHRHGLAATLYERETGPGSRTQGGSLDLHPDAGQRALAIAGLTESFWAYARTDGEESTILDPSGRVVAHLTPDSAAPVAERPEIDRPRLRTLLLDAVPVDRLRWGSELVRTEPRASGGWKLGFRDGTVVTCDLLVGADGARSRVRRLCTGAAAEFRYAYVELAIADADRTAPHVAAMVGPGSLRVLGDNLNLMAQRNGDGSIRVSVSARGGERWPLEHGVDETDPVGTKARLRLLFDGWEPRLLALLDATEDQLAYRPVYADPITVGWPTRSDVTLIGDAAHLMAPTGDGANHAMLDGALLGLALAEAHRVGDEDRAALASALRRYERAMFARASRVAAHSRTMEEVGVGPNAAVRLTELFADQRRSRSTS